MAILRCTVSRHAAAWAESLEGAIRGHQSLGRAMPLPLPLAAG